MNPEVLQANPHHGLRYVVSDVRRTIAAPGVQLIFSWLGDRWGHALVIGNDAGAADPSRELARSVESDADRDDPARVVSPAYQELREHPFDDGIRVLLTGQATPHHFSAVVTVRCAGGGIAFEFDVADRCRGHVAALGATYLVPLGSSDLADGTAQRVAWRSEGLGQGRVLEFASDGPACVSLAEAGRRASRVQALASIEPRERTHRLVYQWRWLSPASAV